MAVVVGLTGGIATGKSTVARMLTQRGAHLIDADQIAREVVEPGKKAGNGFVNVSGRRYFAPTVLSIGRRYVRWSFEIQKHVVI